MVRINIDTASLQREADSVNKAIADGCEKAVQKATFEIRDLAKQFAPVRTGFLKGSIVAEVKGIHGVVEAQAPYSGYVENGTRYMAARPFMRPAFNIGTKGIKAKITEELE